MDDELERARRHASPFIVEGEAEAKREANSEPARGLVGSVAGMEVDWKFRVARLDPRTDGSPARSRQLLLAATAG